MKTKIESLTEKLPGFNCGRCGYQSCSDFALALTRKERVPKDCPVLLQNRFTNLQTQLHTLLNKEESLKEKYSLPKGLDGYNADLILHPLKGEPACRESIVNFSMPILNPGDFIKYRPLGCPIQHFAEVLQQEKGIIHVWVKGPGIQTKTKEILDLGVALILSFEGEWEAPIPPQVNQTIRFIPHHCMMQKVHSGVVVKAINKTIQIDCIDLKVWETQKII